MDSETKGLKMLNLFETGKKIDSRTSKAETQLGKMLEHNRSLSCDKTVVLSIWSKIAAV